MIIATAGHVDHGKTTLIHALTGTDTTHLPEERRRGMTIDLGFASLPLPGGGHLAFIDVPGHERFVRNMLAGVTGVDLALLVVAADDGVMPQTREHLEILDLLQVGAGLVALTKCDRVDAARVAALTAEIGDLLATTHLAGAPVLPVSATTGDGIDALRQRLVDAARAPTRPRAGAHFRLCIDRAFSVDGAGLVVTGTVAAGRVAVDAELRLLPDGRAVRVRALHAHGRQVAALAAGERCAINLLAPELRREQLARGQWLVAPAVATATRHVDARLAPARAARLRDGAQVQFCHGAAHHAARVVLLENAGDTCRVQLVLATPAHVLARDRFILRHGDGGSTLAGGIVIDPAPPRRGRRRPGRLAVLAALDADDPMFAARGAVPLAEDGIDLAAFARDWNLDAAGAAALWQSGGFARHGERAFDGARWQDGRAAALAAVANHHVEHPDSFGPSARELPRLAALPGGSEFRRAIIDSLLAERALLRDGAQLRLPTHSIELSLSEKVLWRKIAPLLGPEHKPMTSNDIARRERLEPRAVKRLLDRAGRAGLVVCVAPGRYLHRAAVQEYAALAAGLATDAGFSAADFRDHCTLGRGISIELLEYFDRIGYTRRHGDLRRVQRAAAAMLDGDRT